jgi:small GTP-binding protein
MKTRSQTKKESTMKKILVIGDAGVGKTNLIKKYLGENFERTYKETQKINEYIHNNKVIYDYPGQIKFGDYGSHMFQDVSLCVLMYDTTSRLSYKSIEFWKQKINLYCNDPEIIIVGNKIDSNHSKISKHDLVSVKNNINLDVIFDRFNSQ